MAKLVENSSFINVIVLFLALLGNLGTHVEAKAFFVFGDSLVDNGNNNYLATTARADAPPYGIDYPSHRPTGRFSNGLNIPDILSKVFLCYLLIHLNLFIRKRDSFLTNCWCCIFMTHAMHGSETFSMQITVLSSCF
ncbi:GDSL esterase/lipase at5g18430 [Phtheirospermum japonicum]|uniref:GDSL esterase/lipase at5g18430 n=1 Tax=Phtheirospermum japonicum TaxID=374723 RepID=A0A830C9B6_9LAMI|nr:GDSL esterase/lipase at5g18430 [Phtheirospermum japonicum]